ncbi:MAG TPA: HEAT repeat domain-containing protein [Thermoanaerobaculia bacterium]|nr:HEAT repeat domain-containing protein [Thermoanaerobaculia bacterium]HUM30363.1 HEAT repeat domain-containing protein [Thermoanaerobaculia bacterium]HXK68486.1 HEAT repeat domain-containing protein [Thermoanaerobaculia bacterium]
MNLPYEIKFFFAVAFILPVFSARVIADNNPSEKLLHENISVLRDQNPDMLYGPGNQELKDKITKARNQILSQREIATESLKSEIETLDRIKVQDPVFIQESAALIWKLKGLSEADYILSLLKKIPAEKQNTPVYSTLMDVAELQSPKGIPLLVQCMDKHSGGFYLNNEVYIQWPLTVKIVWAQWGPDSWPVLLDLLHKNSDTRIKQSAMLILTQAQYLPALQSIRDLVKSDNAALRQTAITCLGVFGHPDDFGTLVNVLANSEGEDLWASAFALFEYEDLRAIPYLENKMICENQDARFEILAALSHLTTPDSINSLYRYCANPASRSENRFCTRWSANFQRDFECNPEDFIVLNSPEQDHRCRLQIQKFNSRFQHSSESQPFTRNDFMTLLKLWKNGSSLLPPEYPNLTIGTLISVSKGDDLSFYYQVLASAYKHFTNESWADIQTLEELIKRISRKRFRAEIGITSKASKP